MKSKIRLSVDQHFFLTPLTNWIHAQLKKEGKKLSDYDSSVILTDAPQKLSWIHMKKNKMKKDHL